MSSFVQVVISQNELKLLGSVTESSLANWFSSYVQFCSSGHFSKRAEAARYCGK